MRAQYVMRQELAKRGEADDERSKQIVDFGGGLYGCAGMQPASLRRPATEWHDRRDKRRAIRGGVLLQGEMGTCGGVSYAVQEKSLPGAEEGDRAGAYLAGKHGCATAAQHRRWAMGLPGDHRV